MSVYRVAPDTYWSVERVDLKVSDGRGAVRTLMHPEAAVWDLVSRGYSFEAVVNLTRHIASLNAVQATSLVRSTIDGWVRDGLLVEGR